MNNLYLQSNINNLLFDELPDSWQNFNLRDFSHDKQLFDFQEKALKNATLALFTFYNECDGDKKRFFEWYLSRGFDKNLDYDIRKERKTTKYLLEFDNDYPITGDSISFMHIINRMSFWMATGSGKTLIIVKLIELLGRLIHNKEIPNNDILFMAHRDDLLDQFFAHVEEFNRYHSDTRIIIKNLRDYDLVKVQNTLPLIKNEIIVFYYRSDLISTEQKEATVNFRNYDNFGKWYLLLDEAHKGNKEDSVRQVLYSILSRKGFLFNFSATFTDDIDFSTCAFNFNLSKFISEGYGKHIYVSSAEISAFRQKNDFSTIEKQKTVLKALILFTYIRQYSENIKAKYENFYHKPLLLTLVNSVDVEDADLKLFFSELENIANNNPNANVIRSAKIELIDEFQGNNNYQFEDLKVKIDKEKIEAITYTDILENVFNSKFAGRIEVLKIPNNNKEIIFKLQNSDTPFGLIKIGDISNWLKNTLGGYEVIESFDNESYFELLNNDDSDINILMGSRTFYEGWDSNRPNIILYINIGIGSEAKKFVLQSLGRGVRIEPIKNKRRRLQYLQNNGEVDTDIYTKLKEEVTTLESLFIFGTIAENLKEIIKTLNSEVHEKDLGKYFIINESVDHRNLLVPKYKESKKIFAEERAVQRMLINEKDLLLGKSMFEYLGDKVFLVKFGCELRTLEKIKESFASLETFYNFKESRTIEDPDMILEKICTFFSIKDRLFNKFMKLSNEIVHFKQIRWSNENYFEQLKNKIIDIKQYPDEQIKLNNSYGTIPKDEYDFLQLSLFNKQQFEFQDLKLKIKYLANHYYIPLIISEDEKISYISHVINVKSEILFLKELEDYLLKSDNVFKTFDWWMFSKLDASVDDIYIPYYNPKTNDISKFKPDFIFWLQHNNTYTLLFVDPKGTEHTDGLRKIDGFSRLFESPGERTPINFTFEGMNVRTILLMKASTGIAHVPEEYRKYWFDNFTDFANKIHTEKI